MSNRNNGIQFSSNVIHNVDYVDALLKQFFLYHSNFLWDKAKEYIERERDQFRATQQSIHGLSGHSILVSLMNALAQLTLADKNYLALQFLSSKVFQRKDSVKCSYQSLEAEFTRLEDRGILGQKCNSQPQTPHHSCYQANQSQINQTIQSEPAQDVLKCNVDELFQDERSTNSASPLAKSVSPEPVHTPTMKSQSFLSKIFRFSSSKSSSTNNSNPNSNLICNSNVSNQGLDSSSNELNQSHPELNIESMDRFAAHLSGQLIHYVHVRIEMIDLYEKLCCTNIGKKFCILNDFLAMVKDIHAQADRNFHHPVLNQLKTMFMFECDIIQSLLNVHVSIQDWKFLDSLFYLQDAHNKLNMMANLRDHMVNQYQSITSNIKSSHSPLSQSTMGGQSTLSSSSSTTNLRRNITSSSWSSSGSSSLSIATTVTGNTITTQSSNPTNPGNFIYGANQSLYMPTNSSKFFSRNFNSSTMPLLIQWLNRFKLFLLSKYSFYFHSLLMIHLAPLSVASNFTSSIGSSSNHNSSANYAQIESQMRQLCSKHLYDFHTRIVQFVRKCDSSYAILIFDTHGKEEFSNIGYRSPFLKKEVPKGINSYPIIYSYPGEFPKNRIPSLIMIMNDRIKELNSSDNVIVEHDKPLTEQSVQITSSNASTSTGQSSTTAVAAETSSTTTTTTGTSTISVANQSLPNATYFMVRPDPDFTLTIICEQTKKQERDNHIISFLQEITILLKGSRIFSNLRGGSLK